MNFLIVTGLSGAGKSMAVNALEDIGFFCIDNIPAGLLPRILDFAQQGEKPAQPRCGRDGHPRPAFCSGNQ